MKQAINPSKWMLFWFLSLRFINFSIQNLSKEIKTKKLPDQLYSFNKYNPSNSIPKSQLKLMWAIVFGTLEKALPYGLAQVPLKN